MAPCPAPKAILFDLDDTLWPIAPVILQAEESVYAWLREHAPRVAERFSIDSLRQARLALLARQPEFHLDLGKLRRAGLLEAFEQAARMRPRSNWRWPATSPRAMP
jgi:FMN phosphatase YigB (HAD superfamily)